MLKQRVRNVETLATSSLPVTWMWIKLPISNGSTCNNNDVVFG